MTILSSIVLLFLVMDPVGNVPLFVSVLKNVDGKRRSAVILREHLIALVVLIVFLFFGPFIMRTLMIAEPSLSIAGGIILFLIALRMIFPPPEGIFGKSPEGEPFIVPLAVPLIAGPSTIATVLLMMSREPWRWLQWLMSLVTAWLLSLVILLSSGCLHRWLGARGLAALERLMGLLLTAVAVQMFISGVQMVR